MTPPRSAVAALGAALAAVFAPLGASARAAVTLDGGTLAFFGDTLAIVARDGATLRLGDGTRASADAAYLDLRTDRAVLAGHARIARGAAALDADAIALDVDGGRVDLLDVANGASTTTLALGAPVTAPIEGARFAFPDVDDAQAYIRSKHAAIAPHADVRFSPAAFPTSVGGLPVPSYLYTYATAAGFGATSLGGATFDQPYGLFGSSHALTSLHARWLDGTGAAVALQQHVVSGDDAYLAASIDAPLRGSSARGLDGYRRLGAHSTLTLNATSNVYGWGANAGLTTALRAGVLQLRYGYGSGHFSTADLGLRTPDRPLAFGATWSVLADAGFDALRGGLLGNVPDRHAWSTVWRHGIDASIATPIVRGPFGSRIAGTFDAKRTWYDFPHHRDDLLANATLSRALSPRVSLFAGYSADWGSDVYPYAQALFYPATLLPPFAPDGTPWPDRAAYTGTSMTRGESLALQLTPDPNTSVRVGVTHHTDFPQFHGWGFPQWELRTDARFRPFPNIGVDVGRAYDFAWGGTRWVPRWSFAITP